MSRTSFSMRQLRELAMRRLGALAAQLKTRDELYEALARHAPDAVGLPAAATPAPPPAAAAKVAAKPEPKPKPMPVPPKPVAVTRMPAAAPRPVSASAPAPAITAPQRLPRKAKQEERPVVRDFFVAPGTRRMPATFGDDRVLIFARDPMGIFVSWDFSHATFGTGPLRLVVRSHDGRELWVQEVHSPVGSLSLAGAFAGESVRAIVQRGDHPLAASPAVLMPGAGGGYGERWKVHVDPRQPLPGSPSTVGALYGPSEGFGQSAEAGSSLLGRVPSRLG